MIYYKMASEYVDCIEMENGAFKISRSEPPDQLRDKIYHRLGRQNLLGHPKSIIALWKMRALAAAVAILIVSNIWMWRVAGDQSPIQDEMASEVLYDRYFSDPDLLESFNE